MSRLSTTVVAISIGLGVGLGATPGAEACMRRMPRIAKKQQVDPTLRDVVAAEKALAAGNHAKVGTLARRAIPALHQLPPADAAELATRAQRALALAVVRSDGRTAVSRTMTGDTEEDRARNIAWAQLVLTYHAAMKADNVIVKVQLAEALARTEATQARALAILRDLSTRDLMPTATGYAILAGLEPDAVMRDAALTRCRELGGTTCQA